jgi:hypothetical protein
VAGACGGWFIVKNIDEQLQLILLELYAQFGCHLERQKMQNLIHRRDDEV